MNFKNLLVIWVIAVVGFGCSPSRPEGVHIGSIPDGTYEPAEWGKVYPLHYESWKATKNPKMAGKSKYKKGMDDDGVVYDRLSALPFNSLLFNGWGFGVEYNEPNGHWHMLRDQQEIDQSRTSSGGVCLACKTPYHKEFVLKKGSKYLQAKYKTAVNMLPENHRQLGVACIDCHDSKTMEIRSNKLHFIKGLKKLGKAEESLTHQEKRTVACAQCHMSYSVPKKNGKVVGDVTPPWEKSKWGNISIENIVKILRTDPKRREWKQKVTGFKMPYIRHPEFEFYSKSSVHWNAGVACADCHMPYKRVGTTKMSDHDVTSPLKTDMRACVQCHTESATWLKNQVITIQDRTSSMLIRAGYATATVAKLFETLHKAEKSGKKFNSNFIKKARSYYEEAFLRVTFVGAENSMGFHNPTEAARILGDVLAYANKAETLLRQTLTTQKVKIPEFVNLELDRYINKRGSKKLNFIKNQELKDPYGTQKVFLPNRAKGLK